MSGEILRSPSWAVAGIAPFAVVGVLIALHGSLPRRLVGVALAVICVGLVTSLVRDIRDELRR